MITDLITVGIKGISDWVNKKQEIKKIKHEGEIEIIKSNQALELAKTQAEIKRTLEGQTQDYNLDYKATENMEKSFKDEFILIIFMAPLIMAFIPSLASYVEAGFKAIENIPDWYVILVICMVTAIYGFRGLLTKILTNKVSFLNFLKKG